jgi:protein involved in polysaccharide export with SLBB domain
MSKNKEKDGKISEKDLTIKELSEEVKKQKDTIAKNNQVSSDVSINAGH